MSRPSIALASGLAAFLAAPALAQTADSSAPPTRAEIKSTLEARFKAIDSNGDGSFGKAEIDAANTRIAAEAAAAVAKRVEAEFAQIDSDKNGQISLAEFKAAAPQPKASPADATLQRMDADKNGKVSFEEYGGDTLAAFDRLDSNKDGKLSEQEQQPARR